MSQYRTMPFSQFDETRLHYELSGAGEALFLVHGSWVDGGVWDAVVPLLSSRFELVSYDRRGHSRSSSPPGQGSIRDDVEDLAALIEALGMAPAHVAGASLGGSIALRLAASHPELLRSIAVHEPPLFDLIDTEPTGPPRWPSSGPASPRLPPGSRRAITRAPHASTTSSSTDPAVAGRPWTRPPVGFGSSMPSTYLDQCLDPDALGIELDSLGAFDRPALVTYGDLRPPLFKWITEMVVDALPVAQAVEIPGTAHDPQVTHPDAYARVLTEFAITAAQVESG